MLKLAAASIFIVIGGLIGYLFQRFVRTRTAPALWVVIGILGAFCGIWIPDLADIGRRGIIGSLLFPALGAIVLLVANLLAERLRERRELQR